LYCINGCFGGFFGATGFFFFVFVVFFPPFERTFFYSTRWPRRNFILVMPLLRLGHIPHVLGYISSSPLYFLSKTWGFLLIPLFRLLGIQTYIYHEDFLSFLLAFWQKQH